VHNKQLTGNVSSLAEDIDQLVTQKNNLLS